MEKKAIHKVLLYGNSILIAGLTSRLQHVLGWEMAQMDGDKPGNLPGVDFVVVDLRDAKTPQVLPRLVNLSDTSLIGLDALTNSVTVLAGRSRQAACIKEMLELLKEAM
jgi:hypothetical protein